MVSQLRQVFRASRQQSNDGNVQADPDRKLDDHRPQTANRVDPCLFVQTHGLLGLSGPILGVFRLNSLELRLERRHFLGGTDLLKGQGQGDGPHQDGEDEDGDTEVAAQEGVQQHQPILHGVEDDVVPQKRDDFHVLHAAKGIFPLPFREGG